MKRAELVLVVAIAAFLSSCVLGGKQQTAKNVPPVTKPIADATPPAPVRTLSTPQTNVELPPHQEIPDGALEPPQTPPEPAPQPVQAAKPTRNQRPNTPPRNTEPAATTAPATTTPAAPETEAPRPPIQEIVPASDQKRLQDEAAASKREIQQRMETLNRQGRRLKPSEAQTAKLIESFVKESGEAEARGDFRAAAELAQRGLALARELTGGK